jgi:hypothetical protein
MTWKTQVQQFNLQKRMPAHHHPKPQTMPLCKLLLRKQLVVMRQRKKAIHVVKKRMPDGTRSKTHRKLPGLQLSVRMPQASRRMTL